MALIYVSSSYRDLREYRRRVGERLRSLGHVPVGMEADGASEHPALTECLKDVRRSAAYIGILGFRYGSVPAAQTLSYTELEYEEAGSRGTPRWMFLTAPSVQNYEPGYVDADRKAIDRFRSRATTEHSALEFSTPSELAAEVERTVRQHLGVGRTMPPFLPYLCNRQDQIDALELALNARIDRRPVLLVIHGDSRELHHRFVERLRLFALRDLLALHDSEPVCEVRVKWPETARGKHRYMEWFSEQLAASALQSGRPPRRELADVLQRLAAKRAPILVSARLEVTEWSAACEDAVRAFADFWETAPDFPSEFPLIVCLSVVYPPPIRSWWRFGRTATDRIRAALDEMELTALTKVTARLAPRLGSDSVSRQQVDNWISVELARLPEGFSFDEDELRREISMFFTEYESVQGSTFVPMDTLADRLKKTLEIHLAESQHRAELFS